MKRLTILGLVLVAACTRPEAVSTTLTEVRYVPVQVPCLKPGQRPTQPTRLVEDMPVPPVTLTEMVGRLRAKLKEWQDSYGPTSNDLLQICEKVPDNAKPQAPPGDGTTVRPPGVP